MKRTAIISPDASKDIYNNLKKLDIEPLGIHRTDKVKRQLSGHPDIQLFIHKNSAFCHPDIPHPFIKKIEKRIEIILCPSILSSEYPEDIPYNIACTGLISFHNIHFTDRLILDFHKTEKIKIAHVNQGYAKCSTMILDFNTIITDDKSIHKKAQLNGLNSLLINKGYVDLPGFNYGFIGGASGTTGENILLTGSIDHHPDYYIIMEFIEKANKKVVYLSQDRITDIGSILIFEH